MAEFVGIGERVEGEKCEIYTRKEEHKGLREDPITHKRMTVYELSRNCSVEVTEKLDLSEEDIEYRKDNNVHLEIGDKLKAESITLYVDERRKLKVEVKEGQTGRHGGRLISTNKRTIGEIKYPFQNIQSKFVLSSQESVIKSITETCK